MKPHINVIQRNGVDIFVTSKNAISRTDYYKRGLIMYNVNIKREKQRTNDWIVLTFNGWLSRIILNIKGGYNETTH